MPNADGSPTTEELTVARVRGGGGGDEFLRRTTQILKDGNGEFGEENFSRACRSLAQKLGEAEFNHLSAELTKKGETAHRLLHHLAEDDGDLDRLRQLPPERRGDALRDLERDRLGYRHIAATSTQMRQGGGYASKSAFFSPMSDAMSDKEFEAHFHKYSRFGKSGSGRRR
jgi:hypothetical protein